VDDILPGWPNQDTCKIDSPPISFLELNTPLVSRFIFFRVMLLPPGILGLRHQTEIGCPLSAPDSLDPLTASCAKAVEKKKSLPELRGGRLSGGKPGSVDSSVRENFIAFKQMHNIRITVFQL